MSTCLNACFNGCSFTWGEGFPADLREQFIYDRIISKKFNFNRTNIAKSGSSNYIIFMKTAQALKEKQYDIMFVQWSALNRLWLSPGPEAWYNVAVNEQITEYRYRDFYLGKKQKLIFEQTIAMINHDYQNILDLITYCDILINLASVNSSKIVFINGLVPWQNDIHNDLGIDLSASLSNYTKEILDFDHRDDEEIILYFNKLKQKFTELDQSKWVNLFDAFFSNVIDHAPEDNHPGIKSNSLMADKISNYLINNHIL
tara:strand:- start:140 stop:913 length:774 start_codon:yes stop_codon:yes gene_type:complete